MKKSLKLIIIIAVILAVLLILFFLGTVIYVGYGVKDSCTLATQKYDGNCVDAEITLLQDESNSFADRNTAIWALGQLGDREALPVLDEYYNNGQMKCDHDTELCQYELKKAIDLIESDSNFARTIYQVFVDYDLSN